MRNKPEPRKITPTAKPVFIFITVLNISALFLVAGLPVVKHVNPLTIDVLLKVSLLGVLQYSLTKRTFFVD